MKLCAIASCNSKHYCCGLCRRHYQRESMRRWRHDNPEAWKRHQKPETTKRALASYERRHRSERISDKRRRYRENLEESRRYHREWKQKWRQREPEKARAAEANRSEAAKARRRARFSERKARIRNCPIGDRSAVAAIYARAAKLRQLGFNVEVDHKTPLAKGGSHSADNLQIIPATENGRKHTSPEFEPIFIFPV